MGAIMSLEGKVAIVTGGNSGIGQAITLALAEQHANVVIDYVVHPEATEALERQIAAMGDKSIGVEADVSKVADIQMLVDNAVKAFGRLDILVNNAGEQHETKDIREIDAAQIERTFRTNVLSFFFMAKHALRHMKAGSSIVNTTSVTAYQGHKTLLDYSSTKGAIVAFTRSLSEALSEDGIRVNAVAPGPIWTPLIPASFEPERVAKHGSSVPMKRAGQPNEVAPCYVFLASEDASYMSGQVLHPNGGNVVGS
jgi:NAD(P)-dependent dehydrogenase (short-subunit alcohol dehydrogenase family)